MFDLVDGLPVHALVVHAVVVLLPLMAVVSVAFVARPRWRPGLPWAVLGNVVVVAAVYVAQQSGEKLRDRLGLTHSSEVLHHQDLAEKLIWFALAQLVASVIAWFLTRSRGDVTRVAGGAVAVALVLTVLAGGAALYWTYRVGDSGARAVWGDEIKSTQNR